MGLAFWLCIWVIILFFVGTFIILDAHAAFDRDPTTHTFSEYLRKWKHKSVTHTRVMWSGLVFLFLPVFYLIFHLGLEMI